MMIRNSLKIALRNFYKNPAFSIVNVLGLAIGLACFVLTMVYVNYELNYDSQHEKKDQTFLVTLDISFANYQIRNGETTTAQLAETLKANFPEVETATQTLFGYGAYVRHNDNYYKENRITAADSSFFEVFTHEFIFGDPQKALLDPYTVVLQESTAKKYFGDENPYGQVLDINDRDYKITGIVKDNPKQVSLGFDLVISIYSFEGYYNDSEWGNNNFMNFVVLKEGIDPQFVENKFPQLLKKQMSSLNGQSFESWLADGNKWEYHLYSLKQVYLDLWGNGIYSFGFGIVAVFLLTIACINYMNLNTAKSAQRAKEVGVRKAIGACRPNLIKQFLSESIFMSFLSLIVGMGIVEACLPFLSAFTDKDLGINYFDNFTILPLLIGLGLFIGVISGLYPSFILSSYAPVKVLKGNVSKRGQGLNLRNALVLLQFIMSIALIISLMVVVKQTNLLHTKNLGYDKENLLVIRNAGTIKDEGLFKTELRKLPAVENLTFTSGIPSRGSGSINTWIPEGKEATLFNIHIADEDFLETMKINLRAGRFFKKEFATDTAAVIINRRAAKFLNWGDTLHRKLTKLGGVDFRVIGIIEDYHFQTLHSEIKPLLIVYKSDGFNRGYNYVTIRIKAGMKAPIEEIEAIYSVNTYEKNTQFEYSFFEEQNRKDYDQEKQTQQLMIILTVLILFVTALGLYGLSTFATQERRKEIAIRKAIGASVTGIVIKMSWSFSRLVLIANIAAWPLAWYFMNDWLNGFASRINISWWIFILAALLSYLLAIATIIFQAYSAANKNPMDVLRYE